MEEKIIKAIKYYIVSLLTICSLTYVFEEAGVAYGIIVYYSMLIIVPINIISIILLKVFKPLWFRINRMVYVVLESATLLFVFTFIKDARRVTSTEISSFGDELLCLILSLLITHVFTFIFTRNYLIIKNVYINITNMKKHIKITFTIATICFVMWCAFFSFLIGYYFKKSLYDRMTNIPGCYYYVENGKTKEFSDSIFSDSIDKSNSHADSVYDYFFKQERKKGLEIINDPYTAYNIAIMVLGNKYGYEKVNKQNPYKISLSPDKQYWVVEGSVSGHNLGGGMSVFIKRMDGSIVTSSMRDKIRCRLKEKK